MANVTKHTLVRVSTAPSSRKFMDLTGRRFGKLAVVGYAGYFQNPRGRATTWDVTCDCGVRAVVRAGHLRSGHTTSCECDHESLLASGANRRTHGWSGRKGFSNWRAMIDRCTREGATGYGYYGGRGVTVYDPWVSNFDMFIEHIGPCPGAGYTIDRIDPNGHYEPGNVRWATRAEQMRNTRRNVLAEHRGVVRCVAEIERIEGIPRGFLYAHIEAGLPLQEALEHARRQAEGRLRKRRARPPVGPRMVTRPVESG